MPRYSRTEARDAIELSRSYAETLRRLGMCASGGNWVTLKKWVARWNLSVDHFDPHAASIAGLRRAAKPLSEILVEGSSYNRVTLKNRLYASGLKQPVCELCGQGETWQGKQISLILDHVSGVSDDNRIENLRIVCPNCAATLDTHCGRRNSRIVDRVPCALCNEAFLPKRPRQRYCSRRCGVRASPGHQPRPERRKVPRPPYAQLQIEVRRMGYEAVGRRHGVSGNAVRKWMRWYEQARQLGRLEEEAA